MPKSSIQIHSLKTEPQDLPPLSTQPGARAPAHALRGTHAHHSSAASGDLPIQHDDAFTYAAAAAWASVSTGGAQAPGFES